MSRPGQPGPSTECTLRPAASAGNTSSWTGAGRESDLPGPMLLAVRAQTRLTLPCPSVFSPAKWGQELLPHRTTTRWTESRTARPGFACDRRTCHPHPARRLAPAPATPGTDAHATFSRASPDSPTQGEETRVWALRLLCSAEAPQGSPEPSLGGCFTPPGGCSFKPCLGRWLTVKPNGRAA